MRITRSRSSLLNSSNSTNKQAAVATTTTQRQQQQKNVEDTVKDVIDNMVGLISSVNSSSPPSSITTGCSSKGEVLTTSNNQSNDGDGNACGNSVSDELRFGDVDGDQHNQVESITCEVTFDIDMAGVNGKQCPVCGSDGKLNYELTVDGDDKVENVCSKRCAERLRNGKPFKCASCGKEMSSNSQGYLPNFGDGNSVLCSEQCLLKYETENEPAPRCYHCKCELYGKDRDPTIYYWQTMEFCSTDCLESLQYSWGKKCASCSSDVPQESLGKYSVRFGDVIKQFCYGTCLESYKKSLKVCSYCQIDLSGCSSTCSSVTGSSSTKRIREFCDPICRSHFLQMCTHRNSSSAGTSHNATTSCCQCHRMAEKANCIEITNRGHKFLICGTFCLSAFKYSHKVHKIICESCFKFGWPSRQVAILHYSGLTKLFCSRKCLQMYVLRIRRILSCLTCNVKKYNFDLVEKYDSSSGDSKLFCSLYCFSIFAHNESLDQDKEPRLICDWCKKLAILQYHIPSPDKTLLSFCTYGCVLAHQQYTDKMISRRASSSSTVHLQSSSSSNTSTSKHFSSSPFNSPAASPLELYPSSRNALNQVHKNGVTTNIMSTPSSTTSGSLYKDSLRSSSKMKNSFNQIEERLPASPQDSSSSIVSYLLTSSNTNNNSWKSSRDVQKSMASLENLAHAGLRGSPSHNLNHTSQSFKSSLLSEKTDDDDEHGCSSARTFSDKMTMIAPQTKCKAIICKPTKKHRYTQTESPDVGNGENLEVQSDSPAGSTGSVKKPNMDSIYAHDSRSKNTDTNMPQSTQGDKGNFFPVPIFIPIFIPVPVGSASLFPVPLPTPIPFDYLKHRAAKSIEFPASENPNFDQDLNVAHNRDDIEGRRESDHNKVKVVSTQRSRRNTTDNKALDLKATGKESTSESKKKRKEKQPDGETQPRERIITRQNKSDCIPLINQGVLDLSQSSLNDFGSTSTLACRETCKTIPSASRISAQAFVSSDDSGADFSSNMSKHVDEQKFHRSHHDDRRFQNTEYEKKISDFNGASKMERKRRRRNSPGQNESVKKDYSSSQLTDPTRDHKLINSSTSGEKKLSSSVSKKSRDC